MIISKEKPHLLSLTRSCLNVFVTCMFVWGIWFLLFALLDDSELIIPYIFISIIIYTILAIMGIGVLINMAVHYKKFNEHLFSLYILGITALAYASILILKS